MHVVQDWWHLQEEVKHFHFGHVVLVTSLATTDGQVEFPQQFIKLRRLDFYFSV